MNFAFTCIGRKKTLRHLAGILIFIILFNFVDITVFAFADTTGPVIESITVDRIEATVGETITYTVQATDESDIAWIDINVFCSESRKYVNLILQSDGTYKGILNVDNTYPNGLFQVESVSLNDMVGNQSNYSAEEIAVLNPNLGVTVKGSADDTAGPIIESISVDKTKATVGETITYTVHATDVSGFNWASMDVSFGENSRYVQLDIQPDGTYLGTLYVNNSFLNGIYEVNSVTLNDTIGNYRNYNADEIAEINPNLAVTVMGSTEDTVGPVLNLITVDKIEANAGGKITYTILTTEELDLYWSYIYIYRVEK